MKDVRDLRIAYFNGTMVEGQDGVTRTLFKIADYLKEYHIQSKFYSPLFNPSSLDELDIVKVGSIKLPFYKDYNLPLPNHKILTKSLDEFSPNILHIHSPCPLGRFAIEYGHKRNIPVFATYHTHFPSYSKYYNLKIFEHLGWNYLKNLYNDCDTVFVPTKSIINELEQHDFKHLVHLPNGTDLDKFSKAFYNPNWKKKIGAEGKNVLLFVGRLVWEKDLKVLIEVSRLLRNKRNDFTFVFAGDGPAQVELKRQMPDSIFLGRLSGNELSEAYASSDIFVFPSTTETLGIVILEAMASELPTLCAAKNGPLDLIRPFETGLLAEPSDSKDFSEKIEILLEDKNLAEKIKENARQFSLGFSWDTVLSNMFNMYPSVNS